MCVWPFFGVRGVVITLILKSFSLANLFNATRGSMYRLILIESDQFCTHGVEDE